MLSEKKKKGVKSLTKTHQNLIGSYLERYRIQKHWMNFKISEMTNDNQKAINCSENYPIYQLTPS